jgi:hypothetical protein
MSGSSSRSPIIGLSIAGRWSEHVKPLAGTGTCQAIHLGYILSGRMRVRMDDGTEGEAGPGDVVHIASGHDAWVVGEEACVFLDFGVSVSQYARSGLALLAPQPQRVRLAPA